MIHRCTDAECPFVGQRTSKSCGCHKTDEQVLTEQRDALLEALDEAYAELLADSYRDGPRCLLLTKIEAAITPARGAAA